MSQTIKQMRRHQIYYLMLIPGMLYFLIWHYLPMFGVIAAFKDIAPFEGINGIFTAPWVGLKHFNQFFSSHYFWNIFSNTFLISAYKLVIGFPLPILFAVLLNEVTSPKFKKITQTISYLPHFISVVVMVGLINNVFSTNGGVINYIRETVLGLEPIYFLGEPKYFRSILVGSYIWQTIGWESIVFLAAITGIDSSLYEAATIDGAGRFKQFLYITIPGILSVAVIMLILRLGHILDAGFQQILLLYSPSVYEVADVIDTYVYREGIEKMNYSYATAVGLFKSVIGLVLIMGSNKIANLCGQEGLW